MRAAALGLIVVAAGCGPIGAGGSGAPSPAPGSGAASSGAGPSARPTAVPGPTFATYVVRRGDTLSGLAARFRTTLESLAYWNRARYPSLDPDSPGYRPDRIEVGWTLVYLPGQVVDPEHLPPASLAPSSTPVGALPLPVLPADGGALLVNAGPRGSKLVALTFDYTGGPGAGLDVGAGPEQVLQWLTANNVPATIFLAPAAATAKDGATAGVLAALATDGGGTPSVGLLVTMAGNGAGDQARAGDTALRGKLGRTTAPWARPAGGVADVAGLLRIGQAGWPWAISWDVDPGDGIALEKGGPDAAAIVARVLSRAAGGSIIRLQLGGASTLAALPDIIDGLATAGLQVVPLARLLGATP